MLPSSTACTTLAIAIVTLVYLAPILGAGLTEADVGFGSLRGFVGFEHLGVARTVALVQEQLQRESGSWLPLSALRTCFWLAIPNPVVAKAFQLVLAVATFASFSLFCSVLARSASFGALGGIGALLALQLRKPHDAILGDTLGLPLTLELLFLALLAFLRFCDRGGRRWFAAAFLLALAVCASDPTAALLTLSFPIVALARPGHARSSLLILVAPVAVLGAGAALHELPPGSLRWLVAEPAAGAERALEQLVAVVPTSYRAFENVIRDGVSVYWYDSRFSGIPPVDGLGLTAGFLAATLAFSVAWLHERPGSCAARTPLALLGLLFCAFAAIVQGYPGVEYAPGRLLRLGQSFPSAYVGCFGFGIGFALGIFALRSAFKNSPYFAAFPAGVALVTLAIAYGNARVNARVISIDRNAYETVRLVRAAGAAGIFEAIPASALVGFDGFLPPALGERQGFRNVKYLLYDASGRRFDVGSPQSIRDESAGGRSWIVRRELAGPLRGGISLAHVSHGSARLLLVDRALAYREYPSPSQRDEVAAALLQASNGFRVRMIAARASDLYADVLRTCGAVSETRIYDPEIFRLSYGPGFFRPSIYPRWRFWASNYLRGENDEKQPWRYAGTHAALVVDGSRCGPSPLHFTASVYAAAPGVVKMSAVGSRTVTAIDAGGTTIDSTLPATRSRRFTIDFDVLAPAADEELGYPHYRSDERGPARLIVSNPAITMAPRAGHV